MNPDNKALERTYFIGGPPRVCKTILAYKLAEKISGHVHTTDAISNAVKKAFPDRKGDLFIVNKHENLPDAEWLRQHLKEPEKIVEVQNTESRIIWPSILGFANDFCENNGSHILEGVAILPELVTKMKHQPNHIIFVGNTKPDHWKTMLKHAKDNPHLDWMAGVGYSKEKMRAMAVFVQKMSEFFKTEAKKHGFEYAEISNENFDESINSIVAMITEKAEKASNSLHEAKLYTDGGSRGNPGPSAGAFVICNMDDNVVEKTGVYLGLGTNNQAEYKGLMAGLERAKEQGVVNLEVYLDSELVVKQMNGSYKVKNPDLLPIYQKVKKIAETFESIKFIHVPRALNKQADGEVNRILDEQAN